MNYKPLTGAMRADGEPLSREEYEKTGGYRGLRAALAVSPLDVQEIVKKSNLKGRGGAGFPTGVKWSFAPMNDPTLRKYFIVNADEMEPGTMKDRLLMELDPHQLIEGAVISAYAIGASAGYIYIRWEYGLAARRLERAIAEAGEAGYLGRNILGSGWNFSLHLHMSNGRYMCGEETGLINALEGGRAVPRSKPPFPQTAGLWGKPTLVNNVETVCNVPHILANGPEWYRSLSDGPDAGTKIFGASGRVKRPGLWELPMGTTIGEILLEHAGGMRDGYGLKGYLPGGASTDFLTEKHFDVKMDFDSVAKAGSRLGTGTMIVLDDRTCVVGMLVSLEEFFARESCGWCTPCREGLPWIRNTLEAMEAGNGTEADLEVLEWHVKSIRIGRTYCALAPGAIEPLESALKYFRDDLERHIRERRCPWRQVDGQSVR